jgi:hypothetical protein
MAVAVVTSTSAKSRAPTDCWALGSAQSTPTVGESEGARGHVKVLVGGQVEVLASGQVKSPPLGRRVEREREPWAVTRAGGLLEGSKRARAANRTRSAGASRGRLICRRSTTSCRNTNSSTSFDASPRPRSTINPKIRRASKYTIDKITEQSFRQASEVPEPDTSNRRPRHGWVLPEVFCKPPGEG